MRHHRQTSTDGHRTPLAVLFTNGNCNDDTQLLPLLDTIPPRTRLAVSRTRYRGAACVGDSGRRLRCWEATRNHDPAIPGAGDGREPEQGATAGGRPRGL
ncbi:transposase [Streptomyces phytophilus]|uniref:transposase n=1 Tax=Streptomyces phytophilus TaxID=722715 RepID=UPI002868173F|nr:transposase [Streptomyces phytophilus]